MESFIHILSLPGGYALAQVSNIKPNKQDILHMYFAHHSTAKSVAAAASSRFQS